MRPVPALLLVSAALVATPASALAAPGTTLVDANPRPLDVSADGHLVLFPDGALLDRTTGVLRGAPIADAEFTTLDLASTQKKSLVQAGRELYVVDYSRNMVQSANRDDDGNGALVPAAPGGTLIRDDAAVLFTTDGDDPSIVEFDLASQTFTTRMEHARLLDASEDGRVITFSRALPTEQRPAGTTAPTTARGSGARDPEPIGGATGVAVGYRVGTSAPRLVSRSTFSQALSPIGTGTTCEEQFLRSTYTDPVALSVSQDGSADSYTLYLGTRQADSVYPDAPTTWSRLTADGSVQLARNSYPKPVDRLWNDPLSGAYGILQIGGSAGNIGGAWWVGEDGVQTTPQLPNGGTAPSPGPVLPYAGGLHAVFGLSSPNPAFPAGTFDQEREPLGEDATPWMALPRAADPELTASARIDASWASCTPVALPAGAPADYAAVTRLTAGGSAGSVAVHLAPEGKLAATKVDASISWLGLRLWTRTATTDTTIALPGLPLWIGGFSLTTATTLTDGSTLSAHTSLMRWR